MAIGRNWLTSLHAASYKGVPFQTERDTEEGGRRIVTHEFPNRDIPFNEDLGEAKREFDVTAYLASDQADSQADALTAVCAQRGAGTLVLPMQGPLQVRALTFRRSREKDRAGYVAYTIRFIREGTTVAIVSVASLANLIFAAADAMGGAVSAFVGDTLSVLGAADFVIDAAVGALQDGASIFEAIRTTEAVDPVVSGAVRAAAQALFDAAPVAADRNNGVAADTFAGIVGLARDLGDGIPAAMAIPAFEQLVVQAAPAPAATYLTPSARLAEANREAVYFTVQVAAATAYAEAIARVDIPDRQSGIALRANVAEHFDALLSAMSASDGALYVPLPNLANAVTDYLSRAILDRAPIVPVSANISLPSLWWAHRLYRDPARSSELAARARVPHPSFMPSEFEAVAR